MFSKILQKTRKWIHTFLKGTYDHYICFLPKQTDFLSSLALRALFSGILFDKKQASVIQSIPKDAIVIYTTKYKSYFEYLFYYTRYKDMGVNCPEISFSSKAFFWQPVSRLCRIFLAHVDYFFHYRAFPDPFKSGFIRRHLLSGTSALLPLVEKKGFYNRFVKEKTDPFRYLVEIQQTTDTPIYIIPQLMFFSKKPNRFNPTLIDIIFGTEEKPRTIRKLITLFKNPGKVFVEISEPLNLKDFIYLEKNVNIRSEQLAIFLRRNLLSRISLHRQSITGPVRKTKIELKENILTRRSLRKYMQQYAEKHNLKVWEVYKKADEHLDEIAANYSIASINFISVLVGWLIKTMFDGLIVNYDVISKIKEVSKKGPLVFVPCHKSHIDYLILSYLLYKNNMPCPHVAAGKNLSFWPLGPIFRSTGAFFVRRSFKGAVLYSRMFTEYIYKLLKEGFNIELFIEGGRSRTGKLLRPQLGLLSIIINAYKNGACDDLNLVPIFIGYDRVLEESSYVHEVEGGQKEPESIKQVIKAGKFLKKKYGKIYIQFDDPISIHDVLKQKEIQLEDMTPKELNSLCRTLGSQVLNSIDKMTVVTPHAIVASAILNWPKNIFSYKHILSVIDTYMNFLNAQGVMLADTVIIDYIHAVDIVLDSYVQRKILECIPKNKTIHAVDAQIKINDNKRQVLEYYKNNCISFFVPAAFTALGILEKDSFQFSASDLHAKYRFCQELFQNEFTYDAGKTPEYFVRKSIKVFIDDAILMPHPTIADTYNITSTGLRKLRLYSRFLKTYFESYWIVLTYFKNYPKNSVNVKDRLKKIQMLGNRMYKRNEIELREALSKINYENAIDYFISHGIKSSDNEEKIVYYFDALNRSLRYLSE